MKKLFVPLFFVLCFLLAASFAHAQQVSDVSLSTATPVTVSGKVVDGAIISLSTGGNYTLTSVAADPLMYGVVNLSPALYLYDRSAKNEVPAVSSGKAYVRVSTASGPIKKGDPITSSTTPGVGVKATNNGYILGTAAEDYTEPSKDQVGKILVIISPRFIQTSNNILSTLFSLPSLSLAATPNNALRYLVAAILTIVSFYVGFRFFGRASLKGVEAMGRNPLAKKSIILVVVVNASLTFAIMLIGLAVSYAVVVF